MRAAACVAVLFVVAGSGANAQTREFSRTVDLDAGGALRVVGSKGSMRLTSWAEPRVEIRARIVRPDDVNDDYAARAIEATRIEVTGDRSSVSVLSDYSRVPSMDGATGRWGDRREPPVHYEIRAPRNIRLSIDSDRGPIAVSGFEGAFDIEADRGELELRDIVGQLRLEIDRGSRSRVQGVRGTLRLEADRTDLDIDAEALEGPSSIEIDRGDVELRIPEGQKLTVRTDISRRGDFRSDLPIEWSSPDPRKSEGRINGGGAELSLESDRARVELRRRRN